MDKQERAVTKDAGIEVRKNDDGSRTIFGYAAVFDSLSEDLGGFREIIRQGAFDNALSDPDLRVTAKINHEGGLKMLGKSQNGTLRLSTDKRGLKYEIDPPDTQAARDVIELMERGDINESSFAFSLRDASSDRWNFESDPVVRELLDVNLHDVSPVDDPAYRATVVSVREGAESLLVEARARCNAEIEAQEEKEEATCTAIERTRLNMEKLLKSDNARL